MDIPYLMNPIWHLWSGGFDGQGLEFKTAMLDALLDCEPGLRARAEALVPFDMLDRSSSDVELARLKPLLDQTEAVLASAVYMAFTTRPTSRSEVAYLAAGAQYSLGTERVLDLFLAVYARLAPNVIDALLTLAAGPVSAGVGALVCALQGVDDPDVVATALLVTDHQLRRSPNLHDQARLWVRAFVDFTKESPLSADERDVLRVMLSDGHLDDPAILVAQARCLA